MRYFGVFAYLFKIEALDEFNHRHIHDIGIGVYTQSLRVFTSED